MQGDDTPQPSSPVCYAAEADPDYMWALRRTPDIRLKRVYDPPGDDDGTRVLVDRLWPRGVRKAEARLDDWAREAAPSTELRKWFAHEPEKWETFTRRYRDELAGRPEALEHLVELALAGRLTLLFAARDTARNHAVVLREAIIEACGSASR